MTMHKIAAAAVALALMTAGCSTSSVTQTAANMNTLTVAAGNLNSALVQVNITIINDLAAQQKLLAPYTCGAYNLGAKLASNPAIASQVNAFLAKSVTATVANVAVKDICTAAGF